MKTIPGTAVHGMRTLALLALVHFHVAVGAWRTLTRLLTLVQQGAALWNFYFYYLSQICICIYEGSKATIKRHFVGEI